MSLGEELASRLHGRVVVFGVGNRLRGDDAAGSELARRLAGCCSATVIDGEDVPESYLGPVVAADPDVVLLADAVHLNASPGAVALLDASQVADYAPTTHRVPLALVMDYLRRESGAEVWLLAVQPARVTHGAGLSREVGASVALLVELLAVLLVPPRSPAGVTPWLGRTAPC